MAAFRLSCAIDPSCTCVADPLISSLYTKKHKTRVTLVWGGKFTAGFNLPEIFVHLLRGLGRVRYYNSQKGMKFNAIF